ncbi:PP2C family protein-serine/threonine phosphatase [Streptomyces sp. NPDC002004]
MNDLLSGRPDSEAAAVGLGRLEQSLAVAADLPGMAESLVQTCAWMGLVGWALILYLHDGTHLVPCSAAGLGRRWQPPLRPLATTEVWPVARAALGQECIGCDGTGPYPLQSKAGSAAWMALPLAEGKGVAVALRPGVRPFSEVEQSFLRQAAGLIGRYLPRTTALALNDTQRPRMKEQKRGTFALDLATGMIQCDEVFAQLHTLPGAGCHPLGDVLRLLPAQDLSDIEVMLGQLRTQHGSYEVSYRLVPATGGLRHLQARCLTSGDPATAPSVLVGHVSDITTETVRADERETLLREQLRRADRMISLAASAACATGTRELATAACEALAALGADALVIAETHQKHTRVLTTVGYDDEHLAAVDNAPLEVRAPLTDALREQRTTFTPSHRDLVAAYPHYAATLPRLKRHAWAALPLPLADTKTPAACMFSFNRPHAFHASDQAFLIAAAALLGRALDRCRDYDTEHDRAVRLQRGLLPSHLAQHPRLNLAASYHPAAPGAHAGGDWYDAFPLPDGRIALTIGDVEGHNTKAAALMGRLRTALRAYAALTPDPATILEHTNNLLCAENDITPHHALLATCCFIALDPDTGRLDCATAAHPAPLIHTPDAVPAPEFAPGLPLGVQSGAAYPTTRLVLPTDSRVLLYTDGLTDTADIDPDHALDRLRNALRTNSDHAAALALHRITTACVAPAGPQDDSALLLAHLAPPAGGRPSVPTSQ